MMNAESSARTAPQTRGDGKRRSSMGCLRWIVVSLLLALVMISHATYFACERDDSATLGRFSWGLKKGHAHAECPPIDILPKTLTQRAVTEWMPWHDKFVKKTYDLVCPPADKNMQKFCDSVLSFSFVAWVGELLLYMVTGVLFGYKAMKSTVTRILAFAAFVFIGGYAVSGLIMRHSATLRIPISLYKLATRYRLGMEDLTDIGGQSLGDVVDLGARVARRIWRETPVADHIRAEL